MYILTVANRIEKAEFDYIKKNVQKDLRSTLPVAFINALENQMLQASQGNQLEARTLGKVHIAPACIKGSRRFLKSNYADFMTIIQAFGTPDLFITMTANPAWPEIEDLLHDGQTSYDRPDLVVRVFEEKCNFLLWLLTEKSVMGPVAAYFGAFEHQNRSLPHLHLLVILKKENNNVFNLKDWPTINLTPPMYCSEFIQSEIPPMPADDDPDRDMKLRHREIVIKHYLHKCSAKKCCDNPKGKCRYRFPRPYSDKDIVPDHAYPIYRRRQPAKTADELRAKEINPELFGETVEKYYNKKKHIIDNAWVVPHNRALSLWLNAHCNVELVRGDRCAQYLNEYVTKGNSMAFVRASLLKNDGTMNYDEFHELQCVRFFTAPEGHRRIYSFPITLKSHTVNRLQLHLPKQVPIVYDDEHLDQVANEVFDRQDEPQKSMLMAFFDLCEKDIDAAQLKYIEINRNYSYDSKTKEWKKRQHPFNCLIRMWSCSARNVELYALRTLLIYVPGNEMSVIWHSQMNGLTTFLAEAEARGYLDSDLIWENAIEARTLERHSRRKLIDFFSMLLINGQPHNPLRLVEKYKNFFYSSDNYLTDAQKQQDFLSRLEQQLRYHGIRPNEAGQTACEQYGFPIAQNFQEKDNDQAVQEFYFSRYIGEDDNEAQDRADHGQRTSWESHYNSDKGKLNNGQDAFYNKIENAINADPTDLAIKRYHFLYGEGGTGKSFLLNVIIAYCKMRKIPVIVTASTGLASQTLFCGNTAHSTFYCPNDVDENTQPRLARNTQMAAILLAAIVIIIDEISCLNKHVLTYVDKLLRFVAAGTPEAALPFAGKIVILAGDWKQTMPVVKGGSAYEQYNASVKTHPLFALFETHKLTENMRLKQSEVEYRQFCLNVGTGANYEKKNCKNIVIKPSMRVNTLEELIDFVYDTPEAFENPLENTDFFSNRTILAPLNETCDSINRVLMSRLPGEDIVLRSTHKIMGVGDAAHDILAIDIANNHLEVVERRVPDGFPPHELTLRIGAIVFITRNLSRSQSALCNGTRMQIVSIHPDLLTCKRLHEPRKGKLEYISKIRFTFRPDMFQPGMPFDRIQFPVKLAFAMTVNKSQGQTLGLVGLELRSAQCFAHGQANVACTRVTTEDSIRILAKEGDEEGRIENEVCYDILDKDERPKDCQLLFDN